MATKTIKFKIAIKELSVEFEGDLQMADRVQQQVSGAISSLSSIQGRLLPGGQQLQQSPVIDVLPGTSRKRRKGRSRRNGDSGGPVTVNLQDTVDSPTGPDEELPRRRTSSGGSARELIISLRDAGFFQPSPKTIAEIRSELRKRGHTFKSNEISPTLQRLTRDEILKREKNDADLWAYHTED